MYDTHCQSSKDLKVKLNITLTCGTALLYLQQNNDLCCWDLHVFITITCQETSTKPKQNQQEPAEITSLELSWLFLNMLLITADWERATLATS